EVPLPRTAVGGPLGQPASGPVAALMAPARWTSRICAMSTAAVESTPQNDVKSRPDRRCPSHPLPDGFRMKEARSHHSPESPAPGALPSRARRPRRHHRDRPHRLADLLTLPRCPSIPADPRLPLVASSSALRALLARLPLGLVRRALSLHALRP